MRLDSITAHTARPLGRAVRALLGGSAVLTLLLVGNVPLCPFAFVTGQPCPGCGMTRATRALLRGDWAASLRFHPLVLPVAPLVMVWATFGLWRYVLEGRFRSFDDTRSRVATVVAAALGALTVTVWLARFLGFFGGPVPV